MPAAWRRPCPDPAGRGCPQPTPPRDPQPCRHPPEPSSPATHARMGVQLKARAHVRQVSVLTLEQNQALDGTVPAFRREQLVGPALSKVLGHPFSVVSTTPLQIPFVICAPATNINENETGPIQHPDWSRPPSFCYTWTMIIGYDRVGIREQIHDLQCHALRQVGCERIRAAT